MKRVKNNFFTRTLAVLAAVALIVTGLYIPAKADEDEYSTGLILPDDPGFIDPVYPDPQPTPDPEPVDPCAGGHDMVYAGVLEDSTCSTPGTTLYNCSRCGAEDRRPEPAPDPSKHVLGGPVVEMQPTCTDPGYTTIRCTICGAVVSEDWAPAATGHTRNGGTVVTQATCQSEGTIAYACSTCGADMGKESIPKTDHVSDGGSVVKLPTTTAPGEIEYKCVNCGKVLREEQIPVITKRDRPQATFNTNSLVISNIPDSSTVAVNGEVVTNSASGTCSLEFKFPQTGDYTITVTANEYQGQAASDPQSIHVHKPAPPSHLKTTDEPAKGGTGRIGGVDTNMEYSLADQDTWFMCTNSSQPVPAGIYIVRYKATTGSIASDCIEVLVGKEKQQKKTKEKTPTATFNGMNLHIDGTDGCKLSFDGGNKWTDKYSDYTYVVNESVLSTKNGIQIYRPGNGTTTTDSDKQYISLTKQSMPSGITATSATVTAPGTIIGTDTSMQIRNADQSAWTNVTTNVIPVFAGTYYIRRMGYGNALPSDWLTVVIKQTANVVPTVAPLPTATPTPTPTPVPTAIPVEKDKKAEEKKDETKPGEIVVEKEAEKEAEESLEEIAEIAEEAVEDIKEPVSSTGERGWKDIEATFENTIEPVCVNLNEDTAIPAEVFEKAVETSTQLEFSAGEQAVWVIDPASINVADVQALGRVNLGIVDNTGSIPNNALATVENKSENQKIDHTFDIKHEGNFGFKAKLTLKVKSAEPGEYANLYWYNGGTQKMQYIDSAVVNEKREATFNLSHASSYAVVISKAMMSQESVTEEQTVEDMTAAVTEESTEKTAEKKKTNPAVAILIIVIFVLIVGLVIVIIMMEKKKADSKKRLEEIRHHKNTYK